MRPHLSLHSGRARVRITVIESDTAGSRSTKPSASCARRAWGLPKPTRLAPPPDATDGETDLTGAHAALGSVHYMSPEQLAGPGDVDARTDVWALGVVLYELVSGSPPFTGESAAAVGARIASDEPMPLSEAAPNCPPWLQAIVVRCLRKDPRERFADVLQLVRALERRTLPKRRPGVIALATIATGSVVLLALLVRAPGAATDEPAPRSAEPAPALSPAPIAQLPSGAETSGRALASVQPKPAAEPPRRPAGVPRRPPPAVAASTRSGVDLKDPALLGR